MFLSEDKKARVAAQRFNLKTIGTLEIILLNVDKKYITKIEAMAYLDQLLTSRYYISTEVYKEIVKKLT